MLNGLKVTVIMPAYNAAATLEKTFNSLPKELIDDIILTDDYSTDATERVARSLGIYTILHTRNMGYGGNQKTCYDAAIARGADIVVMLHPDYQYSPRLVPALAAMVASGEYDFALGSRILGNQALAGGMPRYKYFFNRVLTLLQNILIGQKMSEYHTGFRCWSRKALMAIPYHRCSDDFVFDSQMVCQAVFFGLRPGEISCPARYFAEASSINFHSSVVYGLGVLATSAMFRLHKLGLARSPLFMPYSNV
ncbi:MAG: glycosyltransferase [Bradyrhizobium sp.]|uniref:glycosyltransferase family 2 protein n=1 Tax=Bradyrhizobium sp. TaxID=376 RepID=UPI00120E3A22|nr:glycosyltransferase family 2 protein [Bradyrhizobium sp.]THD73091.1 MAG: glycosyltransferase [Bradyrhizobium sp.]